MSLDDPLAIDLLGYLAAGFVFLTFCMKTMMALRIVAICSNAAFVAYAAAAHLPPILILHGLLLPLNVIRLIQLFRQVRIVTEVARAAPGEERFDWLVPLATARRLKPDEVLFRKGDPSYSLFVVVEGQIFLPEHGVHLSPGELFGEVGLFSRDRRRTSGAVAVGQVRLAELTEERVQELYFDNPAFAYRLIRLITQRLLDNADRREPAQAPRPAMVAPGKLR